MDKQTGSERFPIAPILLGVFSVFGICLVLLVGQFNTARGEATADDTSTPFKFLLLGTEPGISTASEFETSETESPSGDSNTPKPVFAITVQVGSNNSSSNPPKSTSTSSSAIQTAAGNPSESPIIVLNPKTQSPTSGVILPSRTPTSTRTPLSTFTVTPSRTKSVTQTPGTVLPTISPTRTPTSASTAPLGPGTYDDTDARLVYAGDWLAQSGVIAYQNTLHLSNTLNNPGNSITFRFIGTELRFFYQSGPSLGTISIVLDGLQFNLDQSDTSNQTSEWVSSTLVNGTHNVVITHISGGSINLDYLVVPDVIATATPTQ